MATVARGNRNITKVHHRCMIDRLPAYSQPFAAARPLNTGKHAIGDTPHRAAADDRITKRIKQKKKLQWKHCMLAHDLNCPIKRPDRSRSLHFLVLCTINAGRGLQVYIDQSRSIFTYGLAHVIGAKPLTRSGENLARETRQNLLPMRCLI